MAVFNGQCLIKFIYRRQGGRWVLDDRNSMVDARVRHEIAKDLSRITYKDLPRIAARSPEWLPYAHEGLILKALGNVGLDGGTVSKVLSGEYGKDGEMVDVTIVVEKRLSRYRAG